MLRHELPKNFDPQALARQQAKVGGVIPISSLSRLPVVSREGDLSVELSFSFNDTFLVLVRGRIRGVLQFECHRCLDAVALPIEQAIDVVILRTDQQAKDWLDRTDFWLIGPDELSGSAPLWDCIEEEVMLALPLFAKHEPDCPS
ncbi:MAG: YceD family protein [Pseudomonadota bacterium]